jgi:hypothetical protein
MPTGRSGIASLSSDFGAIPTIYTPVPIFPLRRRRAAASTPVKPAYIDLSLMAA